MVVTNTKQSISGYSDRETLARYGAFTPRLNQRNPIFFVVLFVCFLGGGGSPRTD